MLVLVKKTRSVFGKVGSDVRKETQIEIEKLLPVTFHFTVWGSPLSLTQESINVLRNVTENPSDGLPDHVQLFLG